MSKTYLAQFRRGSRRRSLTEVVWQTWPAVAVYGLSIVVALGLLWMARPQASDGSPTEATLVALEEPPVRQRPTKNIEQIQVGDYVYAMDPETGQTGYRRVVRLYERTVEHLQLVDIRTVDGGELQQLETTDEHPFWVKDRGWLKAVELQSGMRLAQSDGGTAIVVGITRQERPEGVPVYNIETEEFHTYFVAAHGARGPPVLVHNCNAATDAISNARRNRSQAGWNRRYEDGHNRVDWEQSAGRRGNQTTRDHLDQVRDEFLDANPDYRHIAGGRSRSTSAEISEEYLPPLGGGRRGGSYPDLTFEGPDGRVRINTTDTRVDGTMTSREQWNFDRIFEQTGEPIISIPKPR